MIARKILDVLQSNLCLKAKSDLVIKVSLHKKDKKLLVTVILFVSLVFAGQPANAASTIGGKCKRVNSFATIGSKLAICVNKESSLVWVFANNAQKKAYQAEQKKLILSQRKKSLENLAISKEKYSTATNLIQTPNQSLIDSKKSFIESSRSQLNELKKQKDLEEKAKSDNQNNITSFNNSISTTQTNINSLQSQISSQQNTVNYSKANSDSAYNSYISAKAQSDYLSYSYQTAVRDNSAMLSAKILCDFGFGSCGIYNSAQYSYNASIINQYNSASARTSGAYASYSSLYSKYSSDLATLNSLKNQLSQLTTNLGTLNTQKSQANINIVNAQSKISSLELQINQATAKFAPLESAENRISQDVQKYTEMKDVLELKRAEFIVAVDEFLNLADENFVTTASAQDWNNRYSAVSGLQKEMEKYISNVNSLISSLESFLNSL